MRHCLCAFALGMPLLGGCGPYALNEGDSLRLSFEPGVVFALHESPSNIPSNKNNDAACQDAGGAVVHIAATNADGRFSDAVTVNAVLSSATDGQLIPIQDSTSDESDGAIHLLLDSEGTGHACFLPGSTTGNVTITARSGVIETSNTLVVRDRVIPLDGALTLTATPPDSYLTAAVTAGSCATMAEGTCTPGRARRSAISLVGNAPQSGGDIPVNAEVTLKTDLGWLTLTNDCAANDASSLQHLHLVSGAATASLCIDDAGGTATLTATSGTVTATKTVQIPILPSALVLTPTAISTTAGTKLTFSAFVRGCTPKGIGGMPVSMTIESGAMTFETEPNPIQITNDDGIVSMSGIATQGPLTVRASLSTVPSIDCVKTVEVKP